LADALTNDGLPSRDQWLRALLEHWRDVRVRLPDQERAPFFSISESQARRRLDELATRLYRRFATHPDRALLAIIERLDAGVVSDSHSLSPGKIQGRRELLLQELSLRDAGDSPEVFNFAIRRFRTFANLSEGRLEVESLSSVGLLTEKLPNRSLLMAPGGWGKTSILSKLGIEALNRGWDVFFLDLARVNGAIEPSGQRTESSGFEDLFNTTSKSHRYDDYGKALNSSSEVLLLVDGLNEFQRQASDRVMELLNEQAIKCPNLRILAADRLVHERPEPFVLFGIAPLAVEEVGRHVPDLLGNPRYLELMRIPFFLDLELRLRAAGQAGNREGRQEMISSYFRRVGRLSSAELNELSGVALEAYRKYGTRVFPMEWLRSCLSGEVVEKLAGAGFLLAAETEDARFRHQLLHDYLVGRFLAGGGAKLWTPEFFDVATFSGNSPEPLIIAAEIIRHKLEDFVLQVYDWSYSIALLVLAERVPMDQGGPGEELLLALTAMYSEKQFDTFTDTVDESRKRLRELPIPRKEDFLGLRSQEELVRLVARLNFTTAQYREWQRLYSRKQTPVAKDEDLELLFQGSLTGWTAVNVFRRIGVAPSQQGVLREKYRAYRKFKPVESVSFRWRVMHLLGRCSGDETAKLLWEVVLDARENQWVRYGALRSLVEVAYFVGGEMRVAILKKLCQELDRIAENKVLFYCVARSALIVGADREWYRAVEKLVRTASERDEAAEDEEFWAKRLNAVAEKGSSSACG
jgi:hypothetical protein